ncbi:MAG: hypothetical protein KKD18_02125 [Nanoarchaeota archaeon]|nr:hypothetical protein [Nanoarchaeota archaeon]MBU0977188.1 hypothetical protein [Nanoarchaeota archaeon]
MTTETPSIYLIRTVFLCIILLTVINFISSATALNIELDSPDEAELNEEFTIAISADSEEEYDVKIFVHNAGEGDIERANYVSEIYSPEDDSWEDSWYYLKSTFPNEEDYKIKVIEGEGDMDVCVRLRKSSNKNSNFEQKCAPIEILAPSKKEDNAPEEVEQNDITEEESIDEEAITLESPSDKPAQKQTPEAKQLSLKPQEKIVLNKKISEEIQLDRKIVTSQGSKRSIIIYSFTGFCIIVIILLALRRL